VCGAVQPCAALGSAVQPCAAQRHPLHAPLVLIVCVHGRGEIMSSRSLTDELFVPDAGMSLFSLDSKNPRHVQMFGVQLKFLRANPNMGPDAKVVKSMPLGGETYASKARHHLLELMTESKSTSCTQYEMCTMLCKLLTMTKETNNDLNYYKSVEDLERRAIQDWEKVYGRTDHSKAAAESIQVVQLSRQQRAALTRAKNKMYKKGKGREVKKPLAGRGGQDGLGLNIPPAPSGDPSSEQGSSSRDFNKRAKKQAKVEADPLLAFEQSMSDVKSIWKEQQELMQRMAHAIAACNENAELLQVRVAEREAELEVQHEKTLAASKAKLQRQARKAVLQEMLRNMMGTEESGEEGGEGKGGKEGGEGKRGKEGGEGKRGKVRDGDDSDGDDSDHQEVDNSEEEGGTGV
jgi:hypothetical protein